MRAEVVLTGTKAQRGKCGGRILLGDDSDQDQACWILDCHQTPLCTHVYFSTFNRLPLGENFDLRSTFRKLLLYESGSVCSCLVGHVYGIISYDVTMSRKFSDVRHGIVFSVSVQRWCRRTDRL